MSYATTPFTTMFEFQRRSIEQGRDAFERGMDVQRQMTHATTDSLDAQKATQKKGVEVVRAATGASFDALAAMTPGDASGVENARAAVDDQFEAFDALHTQLWDAFRRGMAGNAEAFDAVEDNYRAFVEEWMDAMVAANRRMEEGSAEVVEAAERATESATERVESE